MPIQIKVRESKWPELEALFPPYPIRIRLLDFIVMKFPRRILKILKLQRLEKICSHFPLFVHDLDKTPLSQLPEGAQITKVEHEFLEEIALSSEAFDLPVYQKRLDSNDHCYCLFIDKKLACYSWISLSECSIYTGFDSKISFKKLSNNEAYSYDLYTFSEFRSRGLGKALSQFIYNELAKQNIQRIYAGVYHENFVSLKMHLASGFKLYGACYNYRLMMWVKTIWANHDELEKIETWLKKLKTAGLLNQNPQND